MNVKESKDDFWVLTLVGSMLIAVPFPLMVFTGIALYKSALELDAVHPWVPLVMFLTVGLVCFFLGCWSILMATKYRRRVAETERD